MLEKLQGPRQSPAAADLTQRWVRSIGLAVAVGIAYFLAARLSLALLTKPDGVAVFWPAAGVAAGVLIVLGPGCAIAGGCRGDRRNHRGQSPGRPNLSSAIVFALCNAGEAVLAACLVERYFGSGFRPRQAAPRAGTRGSSDRRDRRLRDRRDVGVQVVPRLDGIRS